VANTTWSTTDKTSGVTLSGGNLTATLGNPSPAGIRAADKQVTGKFYWECTATTWTASGASLGIANMQAALTFGGSPTNAAVIYQSSGAIWVNNVSTGVNLGARSNGDVIGIALDLTNQLIWFRVAPAGNWNNNAGFSPGGTGGISISSVASAGIPVSPVLAQTSSAPVITANFGDTAFSGAVPAGFTSGFTAGATINTNALATQIALEHWLATNPDEQVTQVAIEHWASVAAAAPVVPSADTRAMIMA